MGEIPLNNPHDAFIKSGLGKPDRMASFLRSYLSPILTTDVDWSSLELEPTDFLDEQLHRRHADLLFSARFSGKPIFFQILFEHQRSNDNWMPLRLLTYQIRIWEKFRRDYPDAKRIPPILPIVFFQERSEWSPSPYFRDLLDTPQDLDPEWLDHLPNFKHATINLASLNLDPVADNLSLRAMMQVLRAILEPDPEDSLRIGLRALMNIGQDPYSLTFLRICLTYLTEAGKPLDRESLNRIIHEETSGRLREEAMSIAEQLRLEGRQEGRQEGETIGQLKGERVLLERQLTLKFGELDYRTVERLNHAEIGDLECWGERILDAKSLDDVFGG